MSDKEAKPQEPKADAKAAEKPAPKAAQKAIPRDPCVEFKIVGRSITYPGGVRTEEVAEDTIFFPTVGNKDIVQIGRYRREKGYAVVGYHNFPPKNHEKYKEYAELVAELDQILNPPEKR